jgi:putative transposase
LPKAQADSLPGTSNPTIFRDFKPSPEIICLAVMKSVRSPLSLRNAEELMPKRAIDIA